MKKIPLLLILALCCNLFFLPYTACGSADTIPPYPCDFYGTEELPGTLNSGSVVTAKDPDGIIIGQFTITENGKYGLLSCIGDDSATPEDEGAVNGDIITFYIDGVKQQKQSTWKSGDIIRVDLGTPTDTGAFSLHLLGMPGYSNYNNDINYSGVAVADMILDYLVPGNTDNQQVLMSYSDQNADGKTTGSELARLLNDKSPNAYNFGTTAELKTYSDWGIINKFDPTNQSDCIKQICRWIAYKVPGTAAGKEYVPVAVCTSSDPATNADGDYQHWMSLVGIKTNQDPFPNLPESHPCRDYYTVPESLELYGVYLNDPGEEGLGFHAYVAADVWRNKYFRPIAGGLPEAGRYVAILEPPDPKALAVTIMTTAPNKNLQVVLETPQTELSIYIPGWVNRQTKQYLLSLFENLKKSSDFATLIDDPYFGKALKDTYVTRCFKIDGKCNDDYTIVPFDKTIKGKTTTTAAMIVNNQTGQFQMAFADSTSSALFSPMPWWDAYRALREHIGWREYPINYWLSNSSGSALFPGWSVVTIRYEQEGPTMVLSTKEYTITPEGKITEEVKSPQINILYSRAYGNINYSLKYLIFDITDSDKPTVSIDYESRNAKGYLFHCGNRYLLTLRGSGDSYCVLKAKNASSSGNIREGGVTYVYVR